VTKKLIDGKKILEDAISVFDEVNSKIDSLIDCSVKDFEILNSNFKNLYFNLQHLGEASGKIIKFIELISFSENISNINDLALISKEKLLIELNKNITQIKQLDKSLNYYILIYSNLKQDLSTTKLLFTNLRFDPTVSTDYKTVDKLLDDVSKCFHEKENRIHKVRAGISNIIRFAEEGIYCSTELLWEHIEKSLNALKYIINLEHVASGYKKHLKELEDKMASNTSEIITNLQFQDILRQQIEHVQTSHNEIRATLKSSHEEGEELSLEELYKIRDISTLQSAQLVHANREYQNAVEIILHKINELSSLFGQHNSFWLQSCKPEGVKLQSLQPVLSDLNTSLNSHIFSLTHLYEKFQNMTSSLEAEYKSFISEQLNNKTCNEFDELQDIIRNIEEAHEKNKEYTPIIQINNEISKIKEASENLRTSFSKEKNAQAGQPKYFDIQGDTGIETIKRITGIIKNLNEFFQNNSGSLNLNVQIQKTDNFSIEQVSYYKTFEKEVREIINMLDNLLININLSRSEIDREQLEHVKSIYTMDSERKVHDIVTRDAKNDNKEKNQDNDTEVEFF
jgi:hypothetical protein